MNLIKRFWLRIWPGFPKFRQLLLEYVCIWFFLTAFISIFRGEFFGYPADRLTVLSLFSAIASPFMFFYVFKLFSAAKESVK